MFIGSLPTETTLRVWDCYFLEGVSAAMLIALGILKIFETEILAQKSNEELMNVISTMSARILDADRLMKAAFQVMGPLDQREVMQLRKTYWVEVESFLTGENKKRDIFFLHRTTRFDKDELEFWYQTFYTAKFAFSTTPTSSNGINIDSFYSIMEIPLPNWRKNEQTLQKLFAFLDFNAENVVKFRDFVCGINVLLKGTLQEKLALCFRIYAVNTQLPQEKGVKRPESFNLNTANFVLSEPSLCELLTNLYAIYLQNDYGKEIASFYQGAGVFTFEMFENEMKKQPFLLQSLEGEEVIDSEEREKTSL